MSEMQRVGTLEVDEDMHYQRREWRVQRIAWSLMVVFIALAAIGLFGAGPVSRTEVSAGGLDVELQRFTRRSASTNMTIALAPDLASNGEFVVDLDREFVLDLGIEGIQPTPDSVEVVEEALRYTFTQAAEGAPLRVLVTYRPNALWTLDGDVSVPGGPEADVWTFAYF